MVTECSEVYLGDQLWEWGCNAMFQEMSLLTSYIDVASDMAAHVFMSVAGCQSSLSLSASEPIGTLSVHSFSHLLMCSLIHFFAYSLICLFVC
jgi:hypothetical protein